MAIISKYPIVMTSISAKILKNLIVSERYLFTKTYLNVFMIYPHLVDALSHPTQAS
jgi:hypothetical protein